MAELNISQAPAPRASMFQRPVPEELSERFCPDESASFEAVRQAGVVCLWRTNTVSRHVLGVIYPGKVHYHIMRGKRADILFIGDIADATANFEAIAAQQMRAESDAPALPG